MAWDEGDEFDLVPVDYDPFDAAAARLRRPYGAQVAGPQSHDSDVLDTVQSIPRGALLGLAKQISAGGQGAQVEMGQPVDVPEPEIGRELLEKHVTGPLHQPHTRAGRYGETVGEMLGNPVNYLGPGSLAAKTGWNVASGLASEAGGQLYEGRPEEPLARTLASWGPAAAERAILGGAYKLVPQGSAGAFGSRLVQPQIEQPARISTRLPTAKASTEDPLGPERLIIDTDALRQDPELFAHNVGLVRGYPNLEKSQKFGKPDAVAERFTNHVKDNLLFLHDMVPPEIRSRSQLWYDGANRIANELADRFNVHPNSSAAALASLSPQKDWFQNVSLAHRVHDIHFNHGSEMYSPEMEEVAKRIYAKPDLRVLNNEIKGKTYSELTDPIEKAAWLRLYDEAHVDKAHPIITPEGYSSSLVTTAKGEPAKVAWGSGVEIAKAIKALEANGDVTKISPILGERHKVRNFYNNIIDPNSPHGDVTIDTHAVAAGLLRPLSGNSMEVAHNFGNYPGAGLPTARSSAKTGVSGTYGLYADAYRQAAAERGILPRQMQSITWEAVRGLFPDVFKTAQNNKIVDDIWKNYQKGVISLHDARAKIVQQAGGIRPPDWWRSARQMDAGPSYSGNAGSVSGPGLSDRIAASMDRRAGGRIADGTTFADGGAVGKATKAKAHYRIGNKAKRCGICTMFRAPHSCTSVEGTIRPGGLCDYFEAKAEEGSSTGAVVRTYDVPYLAGSSNDNKTVFIDRRVPRTIRVKRANGNGYRMIDPAEPLSIHERSEHRAMNAGKSYEKAHAENGTADERAWVKGKGLDWDHYEEVMDGLLSHIEHEHPKKPPPTLYDKPYPHSKQLLLEKLEKKESR